MATEVQIALQPQAGQDPAAALAAAAAKLARSTLAALIQQAGEPVTGKVLPPPANLPSGFAQVAVAHQVLTLKLSTPLPVGTSVRIDVQPAPSGPPAVTVQAWPKVTPPQAPPTSPQATQPPLPTAQPHEKTNTAPRQATPVQPAPTTVATTRATTSPLAAGPTTPAPAPQVAATAVPPRPTPSSPPQSAAAPQTAPTFQPAPSQPAVPPSLATPPPAPQHAATLAPAPSAAPSPPPATAGTSVPAPPSAQPQAPAANTPAESVPVPAQSTPAPVAQPASATTQGSPPVSVSLATPLQTPAPPGPLNTAPAPQIPTPAPASPPSTPVVSHSAPQPLAPPQAMMQRLTQAFAPPPPVPATPAPAAGSPAQAAMVVTTQAAAQQQSAAPLMQALAVALPALPKQVADAAGKVLATRVVLDRGAPTGDGLRQAVLSSGVFVDAPKAAGQDDIRHALTQLRGTLLSWLGDDIAPVAAVSRRPAPPARGAVPRAQISELPQPPLEGAATKEAGKTLLSQTEGALSRLKLMQLTSQPTDAARPGAAAQAAPAEWNLEIPMLLGRELAMVQVQIQRDGKGKTEVRDKSWRLRFALRFSVIGEVGAQVTMTGTRAAVAIWADEPHTAERLEAMLPELGPALSAKGLELTSLVVRRGAPREEAQPVGRLMDSTR